MKQCRVALLFGLLVATSTLADLKPDIIDCDAQKAARNAALDATVGVSGGCDAGDVVDDKKDDVKDATDVDLDKDRKRDGRDKNDRSLRKNKD